MPGAATVVKRKSMVRVPGGPFTMGSADYFPEEQPVRRVHVEPFWIDACPVTNAEFGRFIRDTGYITIAERELDPAHFPGADPAGLVPGGLVFQPAAGPVPLDDWSRWWSYVPGANWRHPAGPTSDLRGRGQHPVTHIAHPDATAYADWSGKALPTEAQWEFAARGGLDAATFPWGEEFMPGGRRMANTWTGRFPWEYLPGHGQSAYPRTSRVATYPPNGFGLFDMAGNVWEWTSDYFHRPEPRSCCAPQSPVQRPMPEPGEQYPHRVVKGGSYLCAPNYCLRYRPAARQGQTEDTATCHLGFRCVTTA